MAKNVVTNIESKTKATRQEPVVQITVTGRNGRIVQGKHQA